MPDEGWEPIPECEGYEIAPNGDVRTWRRSGNHRQPRLPSPLPVSPVSIRGNLHVYLPAADGKFRQRRVDALVREVFG